MTNKTVRPGERAMNVHYDNEVHANNVYGHTLNLLARHCAPGESVHLDVGCGFGRLGEHITERLGRIYVGVDADASELAALAARGFETHGIFLGDYEPTRDALTQALAGRRLGSVSILDTLEHLPDPLSTMRALRDIAAAHHAPVIISVPNIAHRDIAFKMLTGRFDYTLAGLLDATHLNFFTADRLAAMTRQAGLHQIGANDVIIDQSDQHFPAGHLALAEGTPLHALLTSLRDNADGNAAVNQFVRAFAPGQLPLAATPDAPEPFLSIVTRTQGTRIHTLTDMFVTLMGQTDTDFEVVVIGHRLTPERQKAVERCIEDNPPWLREKIRLVLFDAPGRTAPLNEGFAQARGRYVSILDDDDVVFAHWVETFRDLAAKKPGAVLRAASTRQWSEVTGPKDNQSVSAVTGFDRPWAAEFDWLAHLHENASPPVSLSFPRSLYADFGMRFDERLNTQEDWDFLLRAIPLCGVSNSTDITSIYRWWKNMDTSAQLHAAAEWESDHVLAMSKLDRLPYLAPPGAARRIRELYDENRRMRAQLGGSWQSGSGAPPADAVILRSLLDSRSWKVTKPLRILARLAGRRGGPDPVPEQMTANDLSATIAAVYESRSWKISAPLRKLARMRRGET